ncbi:DEAD/DEAH box helicase [Defluviimonas sp. 20V17]|uniref:ATP-dependent RNA helicase RhlE n=1 Tax=Allgaiera indica TaxID=765699 RepID=A0AAN4UU41_9RHOB|nr:DEAD/DEAH box helicase [Allgaiera indica]KDB05479.1 DEAD/DEAH box helicase [Defluviimonas sp. 20V17]GHE04638.1 DEAD/DEAH box helicase [Allgaiera indica]SDX47910.1 ATP-dependent RNA helicase RhlE [Allgaiera indica]
MTFELMGLRPNLVENLKKAGITEPTPIQTRAIPAALDGRDVMGLAQTGTGKTAAFGLPIANALLGAGKAPDPKSVNGLILAPTRELANQIQENLATYLAGTHLRVAVVVGGGSINAQVNRLSRGVDLLVATPGRLLDLIERRAVRLDRTRYLVLDEADQMLDLGFIHALRQIAKLLPKERQTLLFSATMPKQMAEIAGAYLTDPVRIEVSPPGKPVDKIDQRVHHVDQAAKAPLLAEMLDGHRDELALVFTRTKHGADRLARGLEKQGFAVAAIHGNKSQGQRTRALQAFRDEKLRILVATDVAARGLDIPAVRHVYNFDLPNVPDNYVHRIGRTARAGREGTAVAFCAPAELAELRAIEKVMGRRIPTVGDAPAAAQEPASKPRSAGQKGRRPPNRGRRGGNRAAA